MIPVMAEAEQCKDVKTPSLVIRNIIHAVNGVAICRETR